MKKWEIRTPALSKTAEPMATKFGVGDNVGIPTSVQNFIAMQ